jgi:VWFA-related protein
MLRKEILALLLLAFAQRNPALAQAGTQDEQFARWPEVHLNVLVIDKSDQPQVALDKSAFHVFEDAIERPLESIIARDAPVSLALLIDTSHSMLDSRAILTEVVTAVTRAMPPGSEVMAVLFNDQASVVLPFTPTDPFPLSFLNHLEAQRGTVLYDAIMVTEAYVAKNARYAKSALVVFSDGMDNHSSSSLPDALRSLQWPGAPAFYFVRLPDPNANGFEKRFSKTAVQLLVSAGGGLSLVSGKDQDPAALGTGIAALIRSQYVLAFTTTDPASNGRSHKLEVRLPGQSTKLKICVMPSYFAPGQ